MKRYLKIAVACMIVLGLVFAIGCGQKATTEENQAGQTSNQESNQASQVKTYNVGTDASYAPFESVKPDGEIVGFDIDLLNAIAKAEDFKVNFVNTAWSGIFASVKEKNDMLISAITITPDRAKEMDFSDPYFESTNYIAVPEDSAIKSVDDLKGKKVSVQQGTTGDEALKKFLGKDYAGIKRFPNNPAAFLELRNNKVDAAVADSGVVMIYLKENPEAKLKIIEDAKFDKEYYGIAVRKGNTELLTKLNDGLKKIKASGEYDQIFEKYFGKKQ